MKKTVLLLLFLLLTVGVYAEEPKGPFEVWIERYLSQGEGPNKNLYYRPMSATLKTKPDMLYVHPFKVVVKNVSA